MAVAVAVLAGCGGSQTSAVRSTVIGYIDAVLGGDVQKSCSLMSGELKRSVVSQTGLTCEEAIPEAAARIGGDDAFRVRQAVKKGQWKISINGNTARAEVDIASGVAPLALRLTKTGGKWYIAGNG